MPHTTVHCSKKSEQPYRLVPGKRGRHKFGGACRFSGITPQGSNIPVQQVLLLDMSDENIPFCAEPAIPFLPFLYPFKYGIGGPEIQYAVVSATEVEILYMSDPEADEPEHQYLQVDCLPEQPLELKPLSYEEARCVTFMREDGYFQPNAADRAILQRFDADHSIDLGGRRNHIVNAPDIVCRNPACDFFQRRTYLQFAAAVSPIPINGSDEFWLEFRGGYVDFCFGFCHYCGTIIAFNVA